MSLLLSPWPGATPEHHRNELPEDPVHLMWNNGMVLCSAIHPKRFWIGWSLNALNWSDLICQNCVHVWTHPTVSGKAVAQAAPLAAVASEERGTTPAGWVGDLSWAGKRASRGDRAAPDVAGGSGPHLGKTGGAKLCEREGLSHGEN